MERLPMQNGLPAVRVPVRWETTFCEKYRVFAVFLICCAILIAAFAISSVWMEREDFAALGGGVEAGTTPTDSLEDSPNGESTGSGEEERESQPPAETSPPQGSIPITSLDLSAPLLGESYIHNETPYTPDLQELLGLDVSADPQGELPLVLILHTHTSEAYLSNGTAFVEGALGDATYSRDTERNILSVGEVLCQTLQKKGITAIHCAVMHDDPTLSGSYQRAAETVKSYLKAYPSIAYVIDLHRDAVTTSDGAFVRSLAEHDGEAVAQVMAVVGSDCNGTSHARWSQNLALALQLRARLNREADGLCRPVSLRNSSYNQELAKYALILEIGTAANSVEEAKRAAVLVGETLADLIYAR